MTITAARNTPAYATIREFYRDKKAERSGVPYIHHIDEGIAVLDSIKASDDAVQAYCLHPLLQADEALENAMGRESPEGELIRLFCKQTENAWRILVLAMEYRKTANSYLSFDKMEDLERSPIREVMDMLVADKVQNRKDFEMYHLTTHPRREELRQYFANWMSILSITEQEYEYWCWKIEEDKKARGVVSP